MAKTQSKSVTDKTMKFVFTKDNQIINYTLDVVSRRAFNHSHSGCIVGSLQSATYCALQTHFKSLKQHKNQSYAINYVPSCIEVDDYFNSLNDLANATDKEEFLAKLCSLNKHKFDFFKFVIDNNICFITVKPTSKNKVFKKVKE